MQKGTGISFNALFNNASIGIIVANKDGNIILANPFLLLQFGYTENELIGVPVEKLIPSRFHFNHKRHVAHYNQHPRVWVWIFLLPGKMAVNFRLK
jgi:PAS domain S-box-containing protein